MVWPKLSSKMLIIVVHCKYAFSEVGETHITSHSTMPQQYNATHSLIYLFNTNGDNFTEFTLFYSKFAKHYFFFVLSAFQTLKYYQQPI